jgi:GTP-binding protein SAR1
MGWFDFRWNLFAAFGWETKTGRIIFLGLPKAGKTTLLGKLATNQVHVHRPTGGTCSVLLRRKRQA